MTLDENQGQFNYHLLDENLRAYLARVPMVNQWDDHEVTEIADLLSYAKREGVRNMVWLTADVHYTAAHHYSPDRAVFQDFDPFWEFVSGPLNAGRFGPNKLDGTFGPEAVFVQAPPAANTSPAVGYQFFGEVGIDAETEMLTVSLKDLDGETLYSKTLEPAV